MQKTVKVSEPALLFSIVARSVSPRNLPMMEDKNNLAPDPIWDAAWTWVRQQYDKENFAESAHAELLLWLKESPAHKKAYDKAAQLWLLTGLVPASKDTDVPPAK
jgi:ferric-dicitrate binding protein FerR (iron transport regulator)